MPKVCPVCGSSYADSNVFCPADGSTLRAADTDGDLIGSVVADRYLVTDLLGEGGMGKVYLARHVRLPLQAAIKVLRPEMLQDPAAIARFNREASNASRIEHERVARVFDFGEMPDGTVYLAMEYIAGSDLKHLLKEGPLPLPRAVAIIRQIADGLDAAHRLGIVHRDLKPDNILVTQDEEGGDRCKIVDFGIAKAIGGTEKGAGLTRTGFVVGTPEFMSPEQLLGEEVDGRSDVYALALMAYQCLTGELPFDSKTPDRGMTARLVANPRALHEVRQDVHWPAGLQAVFNQALDRDPATRTPSAGAFAKALESAAVSQERVATAATPSVSPVTPAAAQPAAAQPAAAQLAAAQLAPPPRVPAAAPSGTAKKTSPLPLVAAVVLIAGGVGAYLVFGNRGGSTTPDAADSLSTVAPPTASSEKAASAPAPDTTPLIQTPASAAAQQTTAPTAAPKGTAAAPPPASTGATLSPAALAARTTLDSLTNALDPENPNDNTARAVIAKLGGVIARLGTASDSTWGYIRLAEAHVTLEEVKPACSALRNARRLATSMKQAEAINNYTGVLGCGQ